jgi:lipopolysaccharide transport system ATP-binding protein
VRQIPPNAAQRDDVSVTFETATIEFPVYSSHGRSWKRSMINRATGGRMGLSDRDRAVVRALNDVSFSTRHGERIGLIGHNGAGKSTLLRAVAGVYEPVRGSITVCGRTASLTDLTLGMDMEATGHENIRIRSLLLGVAPQDIDAFIEEVVAVTELGEFLSLPVRVYSSGMLLRLAFAISTAVAPDILLMDEWIGVGDAAFVKKAHERMLDLVGRTGLMFLASHAEGLIRDYCNRALWLDHGTLRADGTPDEVYREYLASVPSA